MALSTHHTTEALIARYERMYFLTKDRLISFVQFSVKETVSADDIVQDCYIKLWENIDKINDDESILGLLRTYARHRIIDHHRKSAREALRHQHYQQLQPVDCTADDQLLLKDLKQQYQAVIKTLPSKRRTVYQLVKEEGLSHKEVAARLNISTNTIEKHMNEALGTLRNHFTPERVTVIVAMIVAAGGMRS